MPAAPHTTTTARRRQARKNWLIVGGVLMVLTAALAYAARDVFTADPNGLPAIANPQAMPEPAAVEPKQADADLVDDDGRTLWVSPTHGRPLDLSFLPPGVEIVVVLRPAALLAGPEGEKVVAALGPLGEQAIDSAEKAAGVKLSAIEGMVVGWQIARDGSYLPTMVVTTQTPLTPVGDAFQPAAHAGRVTVFAPPTTIAEIKSLGGHPPPLARDVERVLAATDASRDVTIVLRPHALLSDANNVFQGELAPLRRMLDAFFGENISAASLSMNWDENFFVELVAVPTLDSSPAEMSDALAKRVDELPDRVEEFVLGLDASPYGRRVVARLPEMVRRLAAYTRHGYDGDAAVLRCYLPVAAGHNLLMGVELALAEGQGVGKGNSKTERVGVRPLAEASSPGSIAARLQKKTSLRFGREELEAALDMLAQDVGVRIIIRGPDLQLDGITRNQLFAIDMSDRTGEEILVEILRRANPDKLATGPADPRQKLVYTVGPDAIFITTRAKVAERGDSLPAVFEEK